MISAIRKQDSWTFPQGAAGAVKLLWVISLVLLLCFGRKANAAPFTPGQTTFPPTTVGPTSSAPVVVLLTAGASGTATAPIVLTEGVATQSLAEFTLTNAGTCGASPTLSNGQSCTVSVQFSPRFPGMRHGAVVLQTSGGQVLATTLLSGLGQGSLPVLVPGQINTVAGDENWYYGGDGVPATQANIYLPSGLAVDGAGNLFLADTINNRIRRVDAATQLISTVAGSGNAGPGGDGGLATNAELSNPGGIAVDGAGNLFIADTGNNAIRRVDAITGIITTVAGTPTVAGYTGDGSAATSATLDSPQGIALTPAGDLVIADSINNAIRVVTASDGKIETFAGTGPHNGGYNGDDIAAVTAQLNNPFGVAIRSDGAIAIADLGNNLVRLVSTSGTISTIAGNQTGGYQGDGGAAASAELNGPRAVAFDPAGDLYIADSLNNCIRLVYGTQRIITTLAGNPNNDHFAGDGGPDNEATMHGPEGLYFDAQGNLWISDSFNNRVREVNGQLLAIDYPTMKVGKTSQPVAETMINAGNESLTFNSPGLQQAALDAPTTTCAQSSLAPAAFCNMGLEFAPTTVSNPTTSPINGSITWNTNAPHVTPIDQLYGVVLSVEPTSTVITSSANPGLVSQPITLTATVTTAATSLTGTVTFTEGATTWCSGVTLASNGMATCTVPSLSLGVHTFNAVYSGDNSNAGSTSPDFHETIKQRAALVFSVSPNPAVVTTAVTLTFSAADSSGTPTGTIAFYDGTTALATVTLDSNGDASWSTSAFTVGLHSLSAQYSGDNANVVEGSSTSLQVIQASTTTSLSSAYSSVAVGSAVPLTATVTSNIGSSVTGNVQFLDGSTSLGSATVGGNGVASLSVVTLAPGVHTLTAVYSGDTDDATSTSTSITQTIQQIATSTTLGADVDPLQAGATVHLAAIVTLSPGATDGALTGTVTFSDGSTNLGTSPINVSGQATLAAQALAVGSHPITAHFNGSTNYAVSSSAPLIETVQQTPTVTTLSSNSTTTLMGKVASFYSTVTSATGVPTGSITYKDGASILGTASIDTHGASSFSISTLAVGNHQVTAVYSGDVNYTASTSTGLQQTVDLAQPTLSLSGPSGPVEAGLPVQFTSQLASPGVPPTGTITLLDGTAAVSSVSVTNVGAFSFNTSQLAVGNHSLTASYSGDEDNSSVRSSTLSVVVQQARTVTTLLSNTNPVTQGQVLTLNAAVESDSPHPGGTVSFYDGSVLLGTAVVNASGSVSLNPPGLALGSHILTAGYAGDTNHAASTSTPLPELVVQNATVVVGSSVNPSVSGQTVTFTGQITGTPTPTGSLTFRDNGLSLATVPINAAGAGTFATSSLGVGTHTISISYSGDSHFSIASGQLTQTVIDASTSTVITVNANPATFGQTVTLLVAVSSNGGIATGTVNFSDGNVLVGSAPLNPQGAASLSMSTLSPGAHAIVATYAGDGKANPSASQPLLLIVKQTTALSVSSPANPAQTLAPVALTATIASPGAVPPTGSVVFTEGASTLGTVIVDANGHATLTLPQMTAGTHTILANYAGDGADFSSQSPAYNQIVQLRSTTTTLTGTPTDSANPEQITLIAVVRGGGSVPPGGTVTFTNGPLTLGASSVDATGVASITVLFETQTQNVVASYTGDVSYGASQSAATPITAGLPAQFTISVSAPNITLVSHQRTTVTVTVASVKGFTDQIALGCLGLPYAATCTFDKSQLKLNPDGTVSASLVVDTGDPLGAGSSTSAAISRPSKLLLCFSPAGLLAFALLGKGRRKRLPALLIVLLALSAAGAVTGCSGLQMSGTPPGTYTFRVIGTGQGSNTTQAQTVTLVVTQ